MTNEPPTDDTKFIRGLGLLDSTMLVAGSMIGSGVFIVSADIAQTKSQSGNVATSSNFREDVNGDGFIDSADIAFVKSKSGTVLNNFQIGPTNRPERVPDTGSSAALLALALFGITFFGRRLMSGVTALS